MITRSRIRKRKYPTTVTRSVRRRSNVVRRRALRGFSRAMVPRGQRSFASVGVGLPMKMKITHRYVEIIQSMAAGAAPATQVFRCNSTFDPNFTGGGHQPLYRDQMAALYNKYVVVGASITLKLALNNYGSPVTRILLYQSTDSAPTTNTAELYEQNRCKQVILATGGVRTATLVSKFNTRRWFGKDPLDNDEVQAQAGNNPADQVYWIVRAFSDSGTDTSVNVTATIKYHTIWFDPLEVSLS